MEMSKIAMSALILVISIGTPGCGVEHQIKHVNQIDSNAQNGVYYNLPKTLIRVEASIVKKSITRGPIFTMDAGHPPDLSKIKEILPDLPDEAGRVTTSLGTVDLSTRAVKDPDQLYLVKLEGDGLVERSIILQLNESGLITNGTSTGANRTVEYAVETVKTAAEIAGSLVKLAGPVAASNDPLWKKSLDAISEIRSDRKKLIIELNTPMDAASLEARLMRLNEIESELIALFIDETTTTWTAVFDIDLKKTQFPADVSERTIDLIEISETGVVKFTTPPISSPKTPAMFEVPVAGSSPSKLSLLIRPTPPIAALPSGCSGEQSEWSGFFYRIPAPVEAFLVTEGKDGKVRKIQNKALVVSQLGQIAHLPSNPGGTTSSYVVEFYGETGALKSVNVSTTLPKASDVAAVSPKLVGLTDAVVAEANKDSKMAALEREKAILQLRKDIADLNASLNKKHVADK